MRGYTGTRAAPHAAGAKIYRLATNGSFYRVDLKTPLKDAISERLSGLINRCGFDMIYFDAMMDSPAMGPLWYWVNPQEMQVVEKSKRDLLVQTTAITPWNWHIFTRGTCDDFGAVAVKEFLDYHKVPSWWTYHDNFLPAELGWVGLLEDEKGYPATTPDEVELHAVRMMALDAGVSYETTLRAMKANGRTEEMLKLLGQYEELRLSGAVPEATRKQLASGEWHMTRPGEFHPVRYDAQRAEIPGEITLKNDFAEQALKFRLKVAPVLAASGDPSNIPLMRAEPPLEIQPPDPQTRMPGALIQRFEFAKTVGKPLDLTKHRALAVGLEIEGQVTGSSETPVLNIQLESNLGEYREHYIDLISSGPKTVILAEPSTSRTLPEFHPAYAYFKAAMRGFNYGNVVALNLRWMRYPKGSLARCRISSVEALDEQDSSLRGVDISTGSSDITIPAEMKTGDYAEYWGDETIRVFDRNGNVLSTFPVKPGPQLRKGENKLTLKAAGSGSVVFTAITLGK
jgi:hypothetical protein